MLTWTDRNGDKPEDVLGVNYVNYVNYVDSAGRWTACRVGQDPRLGWAVYERVGAKYHRRLEVVMMTTDAEARAVAEVLAAPSTLAHFAERFARLAAVVAARMVVAAARRVLLGGATPREVASEWQTVVTRPEFLVQHRPPRGDGDDRPTWRTLAARTPGVVLSVGRTREDVVREGIDALDRQAQEPTAPAAAPAKPRGWRTAVSFRDGEFGYVGAVRLTRKGNAMLASKPPKYEFAEDNGERHYLDGITLLAVAP